MVKSDLSFNSIFILLLLVLRVVFDRAELGMYVTVALYMYLFVRIIMISKIDERVFKALCIVFLLVLWGYIVAVEKYEEPIYSLRGGGRYLSYFAILYLIFYSKINQRALYAVYTWLLLLQLFSSLYFKAYIGFEGRPPGTLINSNHVSYLLVPYLAISLFCYKKYLNSFFVFVFSLYLGGLGGFVACVVVVVIYLFSIDSYKSKLAVGLLLIPILCLSAFLLEDRIEEQSDVYSLEDRLYKHQPGGGGSFVWRVVTWNMMLIELRKSNNLYTGAGIEYASNASPYFLSASPREPHNDYLRVLLEFGVFGFVVYVCLYYVVAYLFFKRYKILNSQLALSLCVVMISLGVGQLVGNIVTQSTMWWIFFSFVGIELRGKSLS